MVYVSLDLEQLREQDTNFVPKPPFQHQIEAFEKLSNTFRLDNKKAGSGILVLPTGAGKTFTAVRWLCDHVVHKNIKILWLAPSYYLLDQAFSTFEENARGISYSKKTLNIRCVSSNPSHAKAASIKSTDDIVIMTVQTAISNLSPNALDGSGNKVKTPFKKFIENCKETGLFIIVDEAHHSPAYGCRNLLIGETGLRSIVPNSNILGLTATPTYTDKTRRGWLWKIYKDGVNGVIYQADKEALIAQDILARPNYIEVSTGTQMAVDDRLYERLVKEHKDLPESIIETLANDKHRNNLIVKTYTSNKDIYGKTIIFADRWFQCIYIKDKLLEKGIKADAIYSHIDAEPASSEARNKRREDENKTILDKFRNNQLDVLINVRMLTEGADIPNVQSVFITRQTTSSILMNQMIGRALRGKKIRGNSEANVVLLFDDWKRLIDWATPQIGDTKDIGKESTIKSYPLEYISIRLVEELSKSIESGGAYEVIFSKIFPIGWYKTEIVYADSDNNNESIEAFTEYVMVYDHTQSKLNKFINFILDSKLPVEWSKEYLNDESLKQKIGEWIDSWFDWKTDNLGDKLIADLIKIVRHIAQNQSAPEYYSFDERENYDLDRIAKRLIDFSPREIDKYINEEFAKPGTLWKTFYKTPNRLITSVHLAIIKILHGGDDKIPTITVISPSPQEDRELSEKEKEKVKKRDSYTCLCCGANTEARLQVDHIKPFSMGGETSIQNSQTLCNICNRCKGKNEIDFRCNTTKLTIPKNLDLTFRTESQYSIRTLTRVVNLFYHCKAVYKIEWDSSIRGYIIYLYPGNNPQWLLQHKALLLKYIQDKLGRQAYNIVVTTKE